MQDSFPNILEKEAEEFLKHHTLQPEREEDEGDLSMNGSFKGSEQYFAVKEEEEEEDVDDANNGSDQE